MSAHEAVKAKLTAVCKSIAPSVPFSYKFVDDEYEKFATDEERIRQAGEQVCHAGHFYQLPRLVWHGILYGRTANQRDRRTQSIGR